MRPTPEERFWRLVSRDSPGGCWVWMGNKSKGYGRISIDNRTVRAHRFAYELFVGAIPDGLTIDHLCRNRACVNPAHMDVVTNRVNILRGTSPSAIHARKTHCIHGHEFTEENTYRRPSLPTGRACRTCSRLRNAKREDQPPVEEEPDEL